MTINMLRKSCLKPNYSLRYQIWISFGSISTIAILVIMSTSIAVSISAGRRVQSHAEKRLSAQVIRTVKVSSQSIADTISRRSASIAGAVALLAEATKDRIVGENWEIDAEVPFLDMLTNTPKYPIAPVYLPPDWNITTNVNENNYLEHIQEKRKSWYTDTQISTEHATFRFQGQCDPAAVEGDRTYYPNCTDENNNVETCGALKPVPSKLHEKVGILQYILKPLHEAHVTIKLLGVYFVNEGAGASVVYPPHILDGGSSFESIGCDWMLENINPHTGRPFGSAEQVARCHKAGDRVPAREYNPLERQWCANQAIAGGVNVVWGPYLDAFDDLWLLSFGKAVFDRVTGEFMACTLADVSLDHLDALMMEFAQDDSELVMVRWKDAEIIAGVGIQRENSAEETRTVVDVGVSMQEVEAIKSGIYKGQQDYGNTEHLYTDSTGRFIAAYPIPTPPLEYDPEYSPHSILAMIVSEKWWASIDEMEEAVSRDIRTIVAISAGLGALGLIVSLLLILLVSHCLTRPLQWMERISERIIYSEDVTNGQDEKALIRWTPNTEITSLVAGFHTMIQGFSGDGPAQVANDSVNEIVNLFRWSSEFDQLYLSEEDRTMYHPEEQEEPVPRDITVNPHRQSFHASFKLATEELADTDSASSSEGPKEYKEKPGPIVSSESNWEKYRSKKRDARIHRGRNIRSDAVSNEKEAELRKTVNRRPSLRKSPLFWWIVFLIVIPLLLTIYAICQIVSTKILITLPALVDATNEQALALEKDHINIVTQSKASFAGEIIQETVRDLHVLKRFAEWLLLDVIERTDSITIADDAAEECKSYAKDTCPFFFDDQRTPCDCEWDDSYGYQCEDYDEHPRYLQRRFWVNQRHDSDPVTGARLSTSYPDVDTSPANTSWWDDLEEVPGAEKGTNSSGYETTYDRIRVLSALAIVEYPIYNYGIGSSQRIRHLGTYVGLEADGMLTGFSGCDYAWAEMAHFQSNEESGAAVIRPDLCPLGKYGYDARCRGWYASGKAAGETFLTAPYVFAASEEIALSITAPIYDPIKEKHIGQALLDFIPDTLLQSMSSLRVGAVDSGFAFLISSSSDVFGGDTVVAPNYSLGQSAPAIYDVLLPNDKENSRFRESFLNTIGLMKDGASGDDYFSRTLDTGKEQSLFLAYAPVHVRTVRTVNGSDFSRGVEEMDTIVYSLGIAVPTEDLPGAFDNDFDDDLRGLIILFLAIAVVTAVVVTIMTSMVAVGVTLPVMILCSIVDSINEGDIQDDIPPMTGGSREVNQVYNSFAKLYKIVRLSNTAFFSGNIEWALKFLTDALKLYRNVDDKKAIGVALNNLGNTYLSLYLARKSGACCCQVNGTCVKMVAHGCYDEAIEMATEEYEAAVRDEAINDDTRSDYAFQLANRYFNRGVFLMLTRDDPCNPEDWLEKAREDLESAAILDMDVRNFWIRSRQIKTHSDEYFERLIRRSAGLMTSFEDGSEDVQALLHEADSLLCSIGRDGDSPLIQNVTLSGRLQQLEEVAIRNELKCGNVKGAARFAIRMLIEDEYLIESAFSAAAEALLQSMQSCDDLHWTSETIKTTQASFRQMIKACKPTEALPSLEKNVIFALDATLSLKDERLQATQEGVVQLYDRVCNEDDQIGMLVFSGRVDEDCTFSLTKNSYAVSEKLSELSFHARGQTQLSRGFHRALDMVESSEDETWLVLVTDCQFWSEPNDWNDVHNKCLEMSRQQPIHLVIIGVDLPEEMASNLRSICRQRSSALIEASGSMQSIAEAFEGVSTMIDGGGALRGFTMEKF